MLSRRQVLGQGFEYRRDLIPLRYSEHAKARLEERVHGVIVAPTVVRVSEDNIYTGTAKNGKLIEVTVRLNYKSDKWMYLAIVLDSGTVKTIWIDDKKKKISAQDRAKYPVPEADCIREEVGTVQESLEQEDTRIASLWNTIKRGATKLLLRPSTGEEKLP